MVNIKIKSEVDFWNKIKQYEKEGFVLLGDTKYYSEFCKTIPNGRELKLSVWGRKGILFGTKTLSELRNLLFLYWDNDCWRGGTILQFKRESELK